MGMEFQYPPLPPGDGLRVLTLFPGQFWDPLEGTLISVPFSKKPKYIALSYTWGDTDSHHAKIPAMPPPAVPAVSTGTETKGGATEPALPPPDAPAPDPAPAPYIALDGQVLALYHNAALALRFLRSATHALPLWLDAVCINQGSISERNAQVALMGFIFTRAAAVVAWLGVPELANTGLPTTDVLEGLWRRGIAQQIAERFAEAVVGGGGASASGSGSASAPDLFNFASPLLMPDSELKESVWHHIACGEVVPRVHANSYWSRLWVVQEACLPRSLGFVFGGEVWHEGALRQMLIRADRVPGRVVGGPQTDMQILLWARQQRFTDSMRLEALVERFMRNGCAELRDRVFSLVGLANDVDAVALEGAGHAPPVMAQKRGRAELEIDYKRSFYDIWSDVVSYMYFCAKPQLDFGKEPLEMEDERGVRLVRFAGVVQKAFDGRVDEKLRHRSVAGSDERDRVMLRAKGYVAGTVIHLGPTYSDFIGSYREQRRWVGSCDMHYQGQDASAFPKLREMEDAYSVKIIDYTEADVSRICGISGTGTMAWSVLQPPAPPPAKANTGQEHSLDTPLPGGDPVRFLGTDCCLGLAPPETRCGDLVVRFWNCDAAVVVRRTDHHSVGDGSPEYYELVGRADVAEPYTRRGDGSDHQAKDLMRVSGGTWPPKGVAAKDWPKAAPAGLKTKAMYVRTDFETLRKISAAIAV